VNRPRPGGAASGGTQTVKAVAVVVLVLLVGWLVLLKGTKTPSTTAAGHTTTTRHGHATTTLPGLGTTTTTVALISPANIKVQVLNGVGGTAPLAGDWSRKLHSTAGYDVLTALDATAHVTTSAIYIITPGYTREADQLANAVGLPSTAVVPTIPAPTTAPIPTSVRSVANLVLVIGPNLVASA
jgi:hypothetical protein